MADGATIIGRIFFPESSRIVAGTARLDNSKQLLIVRDNDTTEIARTLITDIKFDQPLGREPRRLTMPNGLVFESSDHAKIYEISGESWADTLHALETRSSRLLVIGAICVFAAVVVWQFI